MQTNKEKTFTKQSKLMKSIYKLDKVHNQSTKYYSNRNSPRSSYKPSDHILFPVILDSDPTSPPNIYIHPQIIDDSTQVNEKLESCVDQEKLKQYSRTERAKYAQIDGESRVAMGEEGKDNSNPKRFKIKEKKKEDKYILKHALSSTSKDYHFPKNTSNMCSVMETNELRNLNEKISDLLSENDKLRSGNMELRKKVEKLQHKLDQYEAAVGPYRNNVNIMDQKLKVIQKFFNEYRNEYNETEIKKKIKEGEITDKHKNSLNYELELLKITQQRQNEQYEEKINRLNLAMQEMNRNKREKQLYQQNLQREVQCMQSIINHGTYLNHLKERLRMAGEELYQYKIENYQLKKNQKQRDLLIKKLKDKISLLTSLIGYGVVTSAENNDLCDLQTFKESLSIRNGIQQRQTFDTFGMISLSKNKTALKLMEQQMMLPITPAPCLYLPNFLVFYNDDHLKNALEDSTTIVIKPQFFLMIRSVFDSRYNQYTMYRKSVNKFPDFVFGFIELFRLNKKQKRIELNPNFNMRRNQQFEIENNNEIAKSSFFIKIFDKKIGSLLEIMTFKEFLFRNVAEDETFYFLMCRNIILRGPQLTNYINCSDATILVDYEHTHSVILELLDKNDKQSKTSIIRHINTKKILKNKRIFIRLSYVLRLLLQVYRKQKQKKIIQLKYIFENTLQRLRSQTLEYPFFSQLLQNNFRFLSRSTICGYYRKTVGVYSCQNGKNFFDCFNAACLPDIFLKQNLTQQNQLKNKFFYPNQEKNLNYLLQLVPDSVYLLGSEELYREFLSLIKLKQLGVEDHIKITGLFTKMILAYINSIMSSNRFFIENNPMKQKIEDICQIFQKFNNSAIDLLNKSLKKREKYEQKLDAASSKIGLHFRNKIKEFYSEFIDDINRQVFNKPR